MTSEDGLAANEVEMPDGPPEKMATPVGLMDANRRPAWVIEDNPGYDPDMQVGTDIEPGTGRDIAITGEGPGNRRKRCVRKEIPHDP
jgi:hypothetical protein